MSVEADADRLALLADFGVAASWTPAGGEAVSLMGLFDNATAPRTRFAEDLPVETTEATLTVRAIDLPTGAARGDAVSLAGVDYLVKAIEPDGTGLASVSLEEDLS